MPSAARLLAALAALVAWQLASPAHAQVLYKWIDADGKVQYSDRPPKDSKIPVTRIAPDEQPSPVPAAKAPPVAAPAAVPGKATAPPHDVAGKRRAVRASLEQRLAAARDNLESAKRALTDAAAPDPEERQVVQQMKAGQGGMHGLSTKRSNCRQVVDKNGKAALMCPAIMPNEAYFERIAKLEEAVRKAEEEVADAEAAWRRGVD